MVKIRLMRLGAKKRPFYRIVAADVSAPRDGKFLEILGYYDPTKDPHVLKVDEDNIHYTWANDIILNDWTTLLLNFVAQIWVEKLCYIEFSAVDIWKIKKEVKDRWLEDMYIFIYKTVEEAKEFIDLSFWNSLISSIIDWEIVNFELIDPNII